MDSMILCRFLRGVFDEPFAEWAALLSAVTGWDVDEAELRETAQRIVLLKRAFNLREGWQPEDDWLPERFLSEELTVGSGRTAALTPATLRSMVDAYWAARGLDEHGRPRPDLGSSHDRVPPDPVRLRWRLCLQDPAGRARGGRARADRPRLPRPAGRAGRR
jgi:aldehyde:ferredoxin oxidoreductase